MNLPECDYCESTDSIKVIDGENICPSCLANHSSSNQAPININEVLTKSREIDNRVQVRTDLFNSATVAIVELKKSIDSDDSVVNKPYALAIELQKRFNHFKSVIFELNEKVVEASNQQKAVQIYLNNLANSLQVEEREKLKLQDINYKPGVMKLPITPKTIRLSKKRIDKKELREYAAKLGVAEFTLQMIVIQKNITVVDAYNMMKINIDKAKSLMTNELTNELTNEVK